ncbi:hypothetical protein G7Y89_g4241 [Cudoniella acicularis]|uniref:Uncharacterized protein n=1 Tax=Cudoniella acicularis TaxID=354080 RepID=A0A8H4RPV4_9HELO|nr:hypothetical protein G7Y89_g4241 [Cudoniella acicularis]
MELLTLRLTLYVSNENLKRVCGQEYWEKNSDSDEPQPEEESEEDIFEHEDAEQEGTVADTVSIVEAEDGSVADSLVTADVAVENMVEEEEEEILLPPLLLLKVLAETRKMASNPRPSWVRTSLQQWAPN